MTTRRRFIAGLLASTVPVPATLLGPAQPAPVFIGGFSVATFPLGETWTTEPIPYSAHVTLGREYALSLIASMQAEKEKGLAHIFNGTAP